MKKNLEILDFEDKKSKAGQRYTRFQTNDGWMSCFDKNVAEALKEFEGKTASVEVAESGEFKNIKKCYGKESDEDSEEVEVEKIGEVKKSSQNGLKSQNAMYVSYAKDLAVAIIGARAYDANFKLGLEWVEEVMNVAIEMIKKARSELNHN